MDTRVEKKRRIKTLVSLDPEVRDFLKSASDQQGQDVSTIVNLMVRRKMARAVRRLAAAS